MSETVYRTIRPHASLAPFVDCYWTISSSQHLRTPVTDRILPDGCLDIIFINEGAIHRQPCCGTADLLPPSLIVGPMEESDVVLLSGAVNILGIRFQPCGAYACLGIPLHELKDRRVSLAEICRHSGATLAEQLAEEPDLHEKIGLLESFLVRCISGAAPEPRWLPEIISLIRECQGRIAIPRMSRLASVSPRQLERQFQQRVGLSPKVFCRIIRFRKLLPALHSQCEPDWADLAAASGFYDQAHLIHDCVALAGVTPRQLWRERSSVGFLQYQEPAPV